jgi:tRNA dimethylallyltransferase
MLPLIILAGPTTSRKSDTAIALAERLDLEVVNADSMQVYKYFTIGTAKPSRESVLKVPHHLIDVLEPDEAFNAFQFKVRALKHIEEIRGRNKIPLLVGGTGLYLKVLMENFNCAVSITEDIQRQVQSQIQSDG